MARSMTNTKARRRKRVKQISVILGNFQLGKKIKPGSDRFSIMEVIIASSINNGIPPSESC